MTPVITEPPQTSMPALQWAGDNPIPVQRASEDSSRACNYRTFYVELGDCKYFHPLAIENSDTSSFQRFTMNVHDRQIQVVDLSKAPHSELLAPSQSGLESLSLKHLDAARESLFQECFSNRVWRQALRRRPFEERHMQLLRACSKIETFLPTLSYLAEKLASRLTPQVQKALIDRHATCPMETVHDGRYCDSYKAISLLQEFPGDIQDRIYGQQTVIAPCYFAWLDAGEISKGRVLDKLLTEELVKAGLTEANPQIFIGRIYNEIANPVAIKHMFMEDGGSRFTCHGSRSHLVQALALLRTGKLTPELLEWMIATRSWDYWLDCDIQEHPAQVEVNTPDGSVLFQGLSASLTCEDPANLHLLLLQKKLSQAADEILKCEDNNRKRHFLVTFGIPPSSVPEILNQQLDSLKRCLSLLEAYTIDSQYRSLEKAKRSGLELDRSHSSSFDDVNSQDFSKARHYLRKGGRVTAITYYTQSPMDGPPSLPRKRVFESLKDFDSWAEDASDKPFLDVCFIVDKRLGA